eukprot:XP_011416898.1 PREDICTED: uncharacterized protein LOC105320596 isoform X2 [Crassostrea gigas]
MTQHKVYMNQIHCSSLLCELAQMWRSQALCDAIIKAGAITAKAHRLVLVAACPMLKSMESASVGSHLEIRLASDIKEESIHTFLQYLYEGCMVLTEDNYKDIEKIGRILQVDSVIKCCSDFYKCLNSSSQYKYDYYDHVEFKHVRQTDMLKFSEKSNKRATDSKITGQSGKRQRIHNSDSPLFSATSRMDDRSGSSNFSNLKDPIRPYKMGPASVSRRTNGSVDVVEDGVQIQHVDKDSSSSSPQVVDTASSMSVSIASQIQPDVNVQVLNMMNTHSTSSPSVGPRIPSKPPLTGPFPTESTDGRSDSPIFIAGAVSRGFGANVVPPSKSFAMGSPTMVPVGPAQFPTFVKENLSMPTNAEEDVAGIKTRSDSRSSLATSSPDPSIVKKEPGTSTPYVEVQEQGMVMVRRLEGRDTDTEQQEEVSSDLEIEEPPPDDSYTGEAGSEASWMAGQAGFRKAQRSVQPRKGNPSPPSRSMYEQHPPESPATNTFTTEQFLRISGLVDPQPNLELVQTDPLNFTDPKDFYMTDDDGEMLFQITWSL